MTEDDDDMDRINATSVLIVEMVDDVDPRTAIGILSMAMARFVLFRTTDIAPVDQTLDFAAELTRRLLDEIREATPEHENG